MTMMSSSPTHRVTAPIFNWLARWIAPLCAITTGCTHPSHTVVHDASGGPTRTPGANALPPSQTALQRRADTMGELSESTNPLQLIDDALAAAQRVRTARMVFHRQERLGLFKTLRPVERMIAVYREKPFSILFTWLDADSEFIQCQYIEGANRGAVRLQRRRGLFGGPGGVVAFPPDLAIVFQKAKLPISEFGPRRVMESLQRRIVAARGLGGVRARIAGRSRIGPAEEWCEHIVLLFPPEDAYSAKLVDVYLHEQTRLPVMIELWMTNDAVRSADAPLDARYVFSRIEINPPLTDDDFRLDVERDGKHAKRDE